jgi:hypothetical protein
VVFKKQEYPNVDNFNINFVSYRSNVCIFRLKTTQTVFNEMMKAIIILILPVDEETTG